MKKKTNIDFVKGKFLHDNVLIKPFFLESKSPVIVTKSYENKKEWGEVVAVGTGRVLPNGEIAPISVAPGDIILYEKYSSRDIRIDGQDYSIIHDEDIIYKQ